MLAVGAAPETARRTRCRAAGAVATGRVQRFAFLLAMAIGACTMVPFFNDQNPQVALCALAAWCCFLVGIWTARRP